MPLVTQTVHVSKKLEKFGLRYFWVEILAGNVADHLKYHNSDPPCEKKQSGPDGKISSKRILC